jgi:hypothetical protein
MKPCFESRLLRTVCVLGALALVGGVGMPGDAAAGEATQAAAQKAILDQSSYWRIKAIHQVGALPVEQKDGTIQPDNPAWADGLIPADWPALEFDDADWTRTPGPFFGPRHMHGTLGWWAEQSSYRWGLICLRGKFAVNTPADLTLKATYRGGIVVRVNGKEVARGHLPADGAVKPGTLATPYPPEAFLDDGGRMLKGDEADWRKYPSHFAKRHRTLSVTLPAAALRKGVNVLAIELHRAPLHHAIVTGKKKEPWGSSRNAAQYGWTTGLSDLTLSGPAGAAEPNVDRPAGFQVWNANPLQGVFNTDYGPRNEELGPIRLVGARNGAFSGQVVAGSKQPIRGLTAVAGDLTLQGGKGSIPKAAIEVRYALPMTPYGVGDNPVLRYRGMKAERFDPLLATPPAETPVYAVRLYRHNDPGPAAIHGAVQPVWITVNVPKDAPAGDYTGTLTLRAEGLDAVAVPVALTVCPWTLPDPGDYVTFVDFVPSPESTALKYKVPHYSDAHFKLMERTFAQIGKVGNKVLYLEMVARTNYGNSQSLVRWIRKPDGSYAYDFSVFDRYLAMGLNYLKPKYVVLYLSDFGTGSVSWGGEHWKRDGIEYWDKVTVTELDPETRKVKEGWLVGPGYWDEAAAEAFWKPVLTEVRRKLKEKGVLDKTLFGMEPEAFGSPATGRVLSKLIPEVKGWANAGHNPRPKGGRGTWDNVLCEHVYGTTPIKGRFGWDNPWDVVNFDRGAWNSKPLACNRLLAERSFRKHERGFGRIGADFFRIFGQPHRESRGLPSNRYPESIWIAREVTAGWLGAGPDGPVSSVRFEMAREGIQECEARIYIETALYTDQAKRARLSDDLVERCEQARRERNGAMSIGRSCGVAEALWYPGSGWQQRSADLYRAAGEVAAALGE